MIFTVASFGVYRDESYFNWLMDNYHQLGSEDLKSLFDLEFTKTNTFKKIGSTLLGKYITASLEYALECYMDFYHGKKRFHDTFVDGGDQNAKLFMRALVKHQSFTDEHATIVFDFYRKYFLQTTAESLETKFEKAQSYNHLSAEFIEFLLTERFTSCQIDTLFQEMFLTLKDRCLTANKYDYLNSTALPSVIMGFSKLIQQTVGALGGCGSHVDSIVSILENAVTDLEQPECASHEALKNHLHYHLQSCLAVLTDDICVSSIVRNISSEHRQTPEEHKNEHLFHRKNLKELNEIADEVSVLDNYSPVDSFVIWNISKLVQSTKFTEDELRELVSKFNAGPLFSRESFYDAILSKKDISDEFKAKLIIDGIANSHITQMSYSFGKNAHLSFDVIYSILKFLHASPYKFVDNIQTNIGRFIMEMQPTNKENYIAIFNKVDAICNHDDYFVTPGKNPDYLRRQAAYRIVTDVYYPSLLSKELCHEKISMNVLSYCFSSITSADCKLIGTKNLNELMLQCDAINPGCTNGYYAETIELITSYILNEKVGARDAHCVNLKASPRRSV